MTKDEAKDLCRRIDYGVRLAVAEALAEHKKAGQSIVIERDGKIITVLPEEIQPRYPEPLEE